MKASSLMNFIMNHLALLNLKLKVIILKRFDEFFPVKFFIFKFFIFIVFTVIIVILIFSKLIDVIFTIFLYVTFTLDDVSFLNDQPRLALLSVFILIKLLVFILK